MLPMLAHPLRRARELAAVATISAPPPRDALCGIDLGQIIEVGIAAGLSAIIVCPSLYNDVAEQQSGHMMFR
jgi:hypothetical protein